MEIIKTICFVAFLIIFFAILILSFWSSLTNLYNIIISFWGFKKAKRDYPIIDPLTRFLILIPAHNEEQVIADTLSELKNINYDKDLYDIYVISDNSTDNTVEAVKEYGNLVIDTSLKEYEREGVGKPGALQYALRKIGFENIKNNYDLVMVLDADNYMDPELLTEINSQYQHFNKPTCIQAYLDSKNNSSLLSLGYNAAYFYSNRFFQLSKYRMHLPNSIGGTGFFVSSNYLINSGGFNYKSLTEDLEMEIEIVEKHGRILWNHFGRIYDEKPNNLKISIRQRTRWAQGHWFVAFNNVSSLIKLFFEEGKWKYIDQIFYLFGMTKSLQLFLILISMILIILTSFINNNITMIPSLFMGISSYIFNNILFILLSFAYTYFILLPYALKYDAKCKLPYYKIVIGFIYMGVTYMYCQVIGLFKWRKQGVWVKTPHEVVKND